MDEVKGKGFLGVSATLFLILYYDLDLNSMKIYGLELSSIGKSNIIFLLFFTWLVHGLRYYQNMADNLKNVNADFLQWIAKNYWLDEQEYKGKKRIKITRPENPGQRLNLNLAHRKESIKYGLYDDRHFYFISQGSKLDHRSLYDIDGFKVFYIKFGFLSRSFLNLFLPGIAVILLIVIVLIKIRINCLC